MSSPPPSGTSCLSALTGTAASMPERSVTVTSRELLDTSRSLLADTRARAVMLPASTPRTLTLAVCCSPEAIAPKPQVAVTPDTEQLPPSALTLSTVSPALSGNDTLSATSSAALVPVERTVKGSVKGTPPSALTTCTTGPNETSA